MNIPINKLFGHGCPKILYSLFYAWILVNVLLLPETRRSDRFERRENRKDGVFEKIFSIDKISQAQQKSCQDEFGVARDGG